MGWMSGRRRGMRRAGLLLLLLGAASGGVALASAAGSGATATATAMATGVSLGGDAIEACCLPDGACVDLPAGSPVCIDFFGGVPQGPGTWCFTSPCGGACCFPDSGECLEDLGFAECDAIDGVFAGFGSDCEPEPCGLPAGACCLPGGGCIDRVPENFCQLTLGGSWRGPASTCRASTCCPGDIDGDGAVGFGDVVLLLAEWGPCSPALSCPADLDEDGQVGEADLLVVLANVACG